MFCSSLRKRPAFSDLPNILLSLQDPKWREGNPESHDMEIPVPQPNRKSNIDMFKFILLSAHNMNPSTNAIARIERLYHKFGGRNVGVIFLLQEKSPQGNATSTFMELQLNISNLDIPIIPLATISTLQTTLSTFQKQLFASLSAAASMHRPNPVMTLLPYCSNNPPIPEHARNVISDLVHSIPELSQAATTQDGQIGLRQWFSDSAPQVAEDVIAFWELEFLVD
ncbi:hypothetical protein EG329_009632 [Mollisiaceae sp. DMI_Dod_QoI]|nr:hypothetical protein EG329_009632 [Helotiales sp. DMI_Dod_QoI]